MECTMTATTMAVHLAEAISSVPWMRVYEVPVAAVQCMPETAPARTSAQPARFQKASSHFCRSLKKRIRATLVAAIAMITEPIT
jgi:hypothetical protein